jgi:hypothetical protein
MREGASGNTCGLARKTQDKCLETDVHTEEQHLRVRGRKPGGDGLQATDPQMDG